MKAKDCFFRDFESWRYAKVTPRLKVSKTTKDPETNFGAAIDGGLVNANFVALISFPAVPGLFDRFQGPAH